MITVLLLSRAIVSCVFLIAGFSKLADRTGSRQSLLDFGVPSALAGPFAILLPFTEILVGLCLLPGRLAWFGAAGALALLVIFIIGIAVALARGRKPDCHCFGQLHSKPIGWDLMGRNVALALIPALLLYYGPAQPSFLESFQNLNDGGLLFMALVLIGLALLVFQSWLIFQLVQQGGRVLTRLDELEKQIGGKAQEPVVPAPPAGLPLGEPAPEFELADVAGGTRSLEQLRSGGKPVILLFTNPGCGPCEALLPEAAGWQAEAAAHFNLAFISAGEQAENLKKAKQHGLHTVLLQKGDELSTAYKANGTPSAVLIRPDGAIGSVAAAGAEAIRSLVSNTINESFAGLVSIALQEGDTAPPLVYPDLDGKMFNLSELRGKPSILLFWNPGCGFCQQMGDDVKAWEKRAAKNGPQMLVISTGTVEANRKLGMRSRMVLDQNFSAGKAFGAGGTPSAILLDQEGRIGSKIAVGRQDIVDSIFGERAVAGQART